MHWLLTALRTELSTNGMVAPLREHLALTRATSGGDGAGLGFYPGADGGFIYGCGGEVRSWQRDP